MKSKVFKKLFASTVCLTLIFSFLTISSYASTIPGDVNVDGRVTSTDASMIDRYVLGKIDIPDSLFIIADVSCDGKITSMDSTLIMRKVFGMITIFPTTKPVITDRPIQNYGVSKVTVTANTANIYVETPTQVISNGVYADSTYTVFVWEILEDGSLGEYVQKERFGVSGTINLEFKNLKPNTTYRFQHYVNRIQRGEAGTFTTLSN